MIKHIVISCELRLFTVYNEDQTDADCRILAGNTDLWRILFHVNQSITIYGNVHLKMAVLSFVIWENLVYFLMCNN